MIILVHSTFDSGSIASSLGLPEYSYWFVRRAFRRLLDRFGIVVPLADPVREAASIYHNAVAHGADCIYFSFDPPHKTVLDLPCPTVPVFAWEFDTIPDETWKNEGRHNWPAVLRSTGQAVTHSRFSAAAVRQKLGESYPIWSIPAPVYTSNQGLQTSARGWQPETQLSITGIAVDAGAVDLSRFAMHRAQTDGTAALRALARRFDAPGTRKQTITLSGVTYTAVFNPIDGRKNWTDLLAAFIWEFRVTPDATLLLKLTHHDLVDGMLPILSDIAKLGAFRCRVILIHGMLPDDEYGAFVAATSYTVNASSGEGQCLPLMEFMSAGRPAITPLHTAMLDYVTTENSFVVRSTERPFAWPQDPRQALRCVSNIVSFEDLRRAYRESYQTACNLPGRYAAMSEAASAALARFCSDDVVMCGLARVLRHLGVLDSEPAAQAPALQEYLVHAE